MIRKRKGKYVVVGDNTGKTLGKHATKEEAEAQITAINMSRARAAGHKLPPPPKG